MPTKNPRVHVVLEPPLYNNLKGLAKRNGLSLSLEARELIREALHSTGSASSKVYTGKHINNLIGRYPMGKTDRHQVLMEQVHG